MVMVVMIIVNALVVVAVVDVVVDVVVVIWQSSYVEVDIIVQSDNMSA